jgi:hypothetical protein
MSSFGSGTSLSGGPSSSVGFNSSAFGLGSTTSSSTSPYGNSPGAGGSSTGYGSTSLFGPYLGNPLATGIPGNTSNTTKAFGQALFNISSSGVYNTNTTGTGGRGNTLGGNLAGRTGTTNLGNLGTGNISRSTGTTSTFNANNAFPANARPYITQIAFAVPAPPRAELRADLVRAIAQAPDLPSRAGITVQVDGDAVVLQGRVATNEERRVVESLVRLTPGVNVVRNELVPMTAGAD